MICAAAQAYFQHDQLAKGLGVQLLHADQGCAQLRCDIHLSHQNGLGGVHGGVIFSLADIAFAVACNTHGGTAVGIQASIHYLNKPALGALLVQATEISRKSKLAYYQVDVTDQHGTLIAQFQGTAYRLA